MRYDIRWDLGYSGSSSIGISLRVIVARNVAV